jgi:excisionase family DNA binding protein
MSAPREVPTLALSVEEAGASLGIGKTLAYDLVNQGVIPSIKLGSKRVVPLDLLQDKLKKLSVTARNLE